MSGRPRPAGMTRTEVGLWLTLACCRSGAEGSGDSVGNHELRLVGDGQIGAPISASSGSRHERKIGIDRTKRCDSQYFKALFKSTWAEVRAAPSRASRSLFCVERIVNSFVEPGKASV